MDFAMDLQSSILSHFAMGKRFFLPWGRWERSEAAARIDPLRLSMSPLFDMYVFMTYCILVSYMHRKSVNNMFIILCKF